MAFDEQIPKIHQALHENGTCLAVTVRLDRKRIQNSVKHLGCLQIIKKPECFESCWKCGQFKKEKKKKLNLVFQNPHLILDSLLKMTLKFLGLCVMF